MPSANACSQRFYALTARSIFSEIGLMQWPVRSFARVCISRACLFGRCQSAGEATLPSGRIILNRGFGAGQSTAD